MSEIPSPSEMAWLRRLGVATRGQANTWLTGRRVGSRPCTPASSACWCSRCSPAVRSPEPRRLRVSSARPAQTSSPGGKAPTHRRRARERPHRRGVRRRCRRDLVRAGSGRRRGRPAGSRRPGLRGRQPTPLARPLHEPGKPARDAGGAGQLHRRRHHGHDLPGRAAELRRSDEPRLRDVEGRRPNLAPRPVAELDDGVGAARAVRPRQRSGRRLQRQARRLADLRARDPERHRDAAHDAPVAGRDRLEWPRGGGDLADRGAGLRQAVAHVRQRHVEPVPRPLLPRLHRPAGERRGLRVATLGRRRPDLVAARDLADLPHRRDPGRAAERPARDQLLGPGGADHRRHHLERRRRHPGRARADQRPADAERAAVPRTAARGGGAGSRRRHPRHLAGLPVPRRVHGERRRAHPLCRRRHLVGAAARHVRAERRHADDRRRARQPGGWRSSTTRSSRPEPTSSS